MATAHILHYTDSVSHRSAILRNAGYLVTDCTSETEMARWFEAGRKVDLVCISESMEEPAHGPLMLARAFSDAPVVLFQITLHHYAENMWDLEVAAAENPSVWLSRVATLLEQSRAGKRK